MNFFDKRRLRRLSMMIDHAFAPDAARRERAQADPRDAQVLKILDAMERTLRQPAPSAGFRDRVLAELPPALDSDQPTVAKVDAVLGESSVCCSSAGMDSPVFEDMAIKRGDRLRLGPGALTLLTLNDGSQIYLNSGAEVRIPPGDEHGLSLAAGQLFASMRRQRAKFVVRTPSAALGVLGTEFDAKITGERSTRLQVLKGAVEFRNDVGRVVVKKRQQAEAAANEAPVARKLKGQTGDAGHAGLWRRVLAPDSTRDKKSNEYGELTMKRWIGLVALVVVLVAAALYMKAGGAPRPEKPTPASVATSGGVTAQAFVAANDAWADDPAHWDDPRVDLTNAPKMFVFRPTRYDAKSRWRGYGRIDAAGRFLHAKSVNLDALIRMAYDFPQLRLEVLPKDAPKEEYDVMITGMGDVQALLKAELARRFGLAARVEKRVLDDVYVMKLVQPGAPGVASPTGSGQSTESSLSLWPPRTVTKEIQYFSTTFSKLCDSASIQLGFVTVIDRTGDSAPHSMKIKWSWPQGHDLDASTKDAYVKALRDQLGVELVKGREQADVTVFTLSPSAQGAPAAPPAYVAPPRAQWAQ